MQFRDFSAALRVTTSPTSHAASNGLSYSDKNFTLCVTPRLLRGPPCNNYSYLVRGIEWLVLF